VVNKTSDPGLNGRLGPRAPRIRKPKRPSAPPKTTIATTMRRPEVARSRESESVIRFDDRAGPVRHRLAGRVVVKDDGVDVGMVRPADRVPLRVDAHLGHVGR